MAQNSFQNIQHYFCNQSSCQINEQNPLNKDQQASTLNTTKDKKLMKNRVSAQNSRIKKKRYIEDLQENQKKLIREIESTEKQIEKAKQQLNTLLTKNKQNDSFNHDEKPTYERLKKLIRNQEHFDQDQANMLIQLLISRIGVTGRQRRRMVDYYTKRLINFFVPAVYRYFLKDSTLNTGILSNSTEDTSTWDKQLYEKLNLDESQKKKLQKMREKVQGEQNIWIKQIKDFNKIRSEIYQFSTQVQEQIMTLKYLFNTRQTGEIIIGVQNRKYNKDICLQKEEPADIPVKKIKTQ